LKSLSLKRRGDRLTVTLSPKLSGIIVTLRERESKKKSVEWKTVRSAKTNGSGKATFTYAVKKVATFDVSVESGGRSYTSKSIKL
jgi:hypothetical protein